MSDRFSGGTSSNKHRMSSRMSTTTMGKSSAFTLHRFSATSLGSSSMRSLRKRRASRLRQQTPSQIFRAICREIMNRKFVPDDSHDIRSNDPSYTNFRVPYAMYCEDRNRQRRITCERRFQYEISKLIELQPNACEAVNLMRHLSITTYWPPLHNRKQLNYTLRHVFPPIDKARLRYLMEQKIGEWRE